MRRRRVALLGVLAGGMAALVGLMLALAWRSAMWDAPTDGQSSPANNANTPTALGAAQTTPDGLAAGPLPRLVAVYQRARTDELQLAPVESQIVWMPNVTDRAAQIVRLVLEGFPENDTTVSPAPAGVKCRGVFIDGSGTAYVDLDGATLSTIRGADEEESLVAAVSRSLVDDLQEVKRVAFLVDSEPRDTLAGHVDLARKFSGREWEVAGQGGTGGTR